MKPTIPTTAGPWRNQREAANAAKKDRLCMLHGFFHIVKNAGGYSWVTGANPPLFHSDRVVATYYYLNGRVWSYPKIVTRAESDRVTA